MNDDYRERCLKEKGEECTVCSVTKNILVHHLDEDRSNNSLDNLVPLCHSCHGLIHSHGTDLDGLKEVVKDRPDRDKSHIYPNRRLNNSEIRDYLSKLFKKVLRLHHDKVEVEVAYDYKCLSECDNSRIDAVVSQMVRSDEYDVQWYNNSAIRIGVDEWDFHFKN